MRILLVEDEPRVAHFVAKGLREQSYAVDIAADGEAALHQASSNAYELIILDVMLPLKNGFEVCQQMRAQGIKQPVLMLTARDAVEDRVTGLDCGADDYLGKPFDFKELLARIRALLRRRKEFWPETVQVADLVVNTSSHAVTRAGRPISLTAKEYSLLEFFVLRAGKLVGRDEIAEHVWDENFDPFSNIIDVYVRRLRKKIDDGFEPPLIHTRRGEGYLLSADLEEDRV
ncbi:MAG TPA: response regulator transcription factor [Blastocatellia bacterium]|nr:response regulator transcription factor [Blastocatellia bacterium]